MASGLMLALFTVSCHRDPRHTIAGKWKQTTGAGVLEFFPDGTVTGIAEPLDLAGRFSFPDASHIRIELGGLANLAGPLVGTFSIAGDKLTIKLKGQESVYKRAK